MNSSSFVHWEQCGWELFARGGGSAVGRMYFCAAPAAAVIITGACQNEKWKAADSCSVYLI